MLAMLLMAGLNLQGQVAPLVIEPPTDQQVLRALGRPRVIVPFLVDTCRNDISVVKNRVALKQPRLFGVELPIANTHWECVAYYRETVRGLAPVPVKLPGMRTQKVYINKADVVR